MSMPPVIEVFPNPEGMQGFPPQPQRRKGGNRRVWLFAVLFTLCLAASLSYVWLRPPVYQSVASLLTVSPEESGQSAGRTTTIRQGKPQKQGAMANLTLTEAEQANAKGGSEHVAMQRQILLGVPVFQETLRRLEGLEDPPGLSSLRLTDLNKLLSVRPVADTNMVELKAEGPQAALLAPLVNAWIDAYQALREQTTRDAASTNRASLDEESKRLDQKIQEKRAALENFRLKNNILSGTDADNTPMMRLKGLNEALNKAIDEQVKAKARLDAVHAAIARGQPVVPKEEGAGLEALERRAQELREQQKDLDRRFTPGYLAIHPQLKQVPGQLAQVQEQIKAKAERATQAMLSQTEQAMETATQSVSELRLKIDGLKRESAEFTNRFAEQETMKADLDRLEEMNRDTKAKLAKIEAKPKETYPPLQVVERAYPPTQPSAPDYWRDSGIGFAASLLIALAVVWLYDFLTRVMEPAETAPMPSFQFYTLQGGLPAPHPAGMVPAALPGQQPIGQLALESPLPRELSGQEIQMLWEAADGATRPWIGLLLAGLSLEEACGLQAESLSEGQIHLTGQRPRSVPLPPRLTQELKLPLPEEEAGEISARIHLAAVDAGLPSPDSVNADALRHSYIAYLVRQGIRLSELERVIGKLPAKNLSVYARYSPPGAGLAAERVALIHPALVG